MLRSQKLHQIFTAPAPVPLTSNFSIKATLLCAHDIISDDDPVQPIIGQYSSIYPGKHRFYGVQKGNHSLKWGMD